jgi:hypothetical protein
VLGDQDQCFIVMCLLRDLLSAHDAFRGPSTGPSTGPSKGWSPSCCAPTASRSASGPASRPTSTSTIQHTFYITQCILHTDIIQLELRKIWLEGEARDPAEEVVGAVRCPVAVGAQQEGLQPLEGPVEGPRKASWAERRSRKRRITMKPMMELVLSL